MRRTRSRGLSVAGCSRDVAGQRPLGFNRLGRDGERRFAGAFACDSRQQRVDDAVKLRLDRRVDLGAAGRCGPVRPRRALPPLMSLTDAAAERLRGIYAKGEGGQKLRISVNTKGCSGLAYDMTWVDAPGPGDEVVTDKDVTVLVDRKASLFLIGTTMDYEVKALSSGFRRMASEKSEIARSQSFRDV